MSEQILSTRNYKAGYVVRERLVDGKEFGCADFVMKSAYNPDGDYIGNSKDGYRLCKKRGIKPEKAKESHSVCSIGFCESEQKWYGWSHRAIFGFGIGSTVKKGDCIAETGWTDEYIAEHPEKDFSLPIGFQAKTIEDAKRMAAAFADSVS